MPIASQLSCRHDRPIFANPLTTLRITFKESPDGMKWNLYTFWTIAEVTMERWIAILTTVFIMTCALSPSLASENKNHVCFKVLDADRDGLVTFSEFQTVYGDDRTTFDAADKDRNGKLSHDEYHTMLGHGSS
jgi:hypothetical protein